MEKVPDNLVSLEEAQKLADLGYRGRTEWFWDRYSPRHDGAHEWRISKSRSTFDNTCCLPAPTKEDYKELIRQYE